jgi:hypothetical protein
MHLKEYVDGRQEKEYPIMLGLTFTKLTQIDKVLASDKNVTQYHHFLAELMSTTLNWYNA